MRLRNHEISLDVGVEMMIYHQPPGRGFLHHRSQTVNAPDVVEIKHANQVGSGKRLESALRLRGAYHYGMVTGKKRDVFRHHVGHHHIHLLAHGAEHPGQTERGAHRIAVGTFMAHNRHLPIGFKKVPGALHGGHVESVRIIYLVFQISLHIFSIYKGSLFF